MQRPHACGALPDIQTSLGSGFSDLQWAVDAYALTLCSESAGTASGEVYGVGTAAPFDVRQRRHALPVLPASRSAVPADRSG